MAKNTAKSPKGKRVRMGRIGDAQLVMNQRRHAAANAAYIAVRVQPNDEVWALMPDQFADGIETTPLFTALEFRRALRRRRRNPEDVPVSEGIIDAIRDALD